MRISYLPSGPGFFVVLEVALDPAAYLVLTRSPRAAVQESKVHQRSVGIRRFRRVAPVSLGGGLELAGVDEALVERRRRPTSSREEWVALAARGRGGRAGDGFPRRAAILGAGRRRVEADAHLWREHVRNFEVLQPPEAREAAVGRTDGRVCTERRLFCSCSRRRQLLGAGVLRVRQMGLQERESRRPAGMSPASLFEEHSYRVRLELQLQCRRKSSEPLAEKQLAREPGERERESSVELASRQAVGSSSSPSSVCVRISRGR